MVESLIMDSEAVTRTVTRISHEIIEKKGSSDEIVIIGIYNRGVPLAVRIAKVIYDITGLTIEQGFLDITFLISLICLSIVKFLCITPIPPALAKATAILDSVTVSIAEDNKGILIL